MYSCYVSYSKASKSLQACIKVTNESDIQSATETALWDTIHSCLHSVRDLMTSSSNHNTIKTITQQRESQHWVSRYWKTDLGVVSKNVTLKPVSMNNSALKKRINTEQNRKQNGISMALWAIWDTGNVRTNIIVRKRTWRRPPYYRFNIKNSENTPISLPTAANEAERNMKSNSQTCYIELGMGHNLKTIFGKGCHMSEQRKIHLPIRHASNICKYFFAFSGLHNC